jgi:phage/plasmid-associated DNA primase
MFNPVDRDGHTIILTETVSPERLRQIIDNFEKFSWRESTLKKHEDLKQSMEIYYTDLVKNSGKVSVEYHQTECGSGRYYANRFCLQSMPRELRHALVYDTHCDLDIRSAHPTLLMNYCLNKNIPHSILKQYVEERDKFHNDLTNVPIEDPKKAILTLINGGDFTIRSNIPKWWEPFVQELRDIRHHMIMDPENAKLLHYIQNIKSREWNVSGSLLNHIVCDLENFALISICYCLQKRGLIVESLAFDGLLVKNPEMITVEMLEDITTKVQKITRLRNLKIVIKPMAEGDLLDSVKTLANEYLNDVWIIDSTKRKRLTIVQSEGILKSEMPTVLTSNGCLKQCGGVMDAYIHSSGSYVLCRLCEYRFPPNDANVPLPLDDRFHILRNIIGCRPSSVTNQINDGLAAKPENMTLAESLVWDAVHTGGGKARLFAHVANGRIRYDGKNTWFVDANIWNSYNGPKELARMRRFEMDEVFPFVVKHRHPSLPERKVLKFDGDSDATDLEKIKALSEIYEPDFANTLDSNDDLLAFTDVVYNLSSKSIIPLTSDLRISKTVEYPFPREKGIYYDELADIFAKIHPNSEIRTYFLKAIACALHGSRLSRNVHLHNGDSGRNGKTLISTLCSGTFGSYYMDLPSGYLQKASDSCGPDPISLELRGKRFVVSSEPPEDRKLQADVIKKLSGGDRMRARDLYASGKLESFTLNLHLHILCNRRPKIDGEDGGLRDRMRSVPFQSMFVDDPNEVDPANHIYPANEGLKTKIQMWKSDFMWMLLNDYYDHEWSGVAPEAVLLETKTYMDSNASEAVTFLTQKTELKVGEKVKSGEVIRSFLDWCMQENIALPSTASNKVSPMLQNAVRAVYKGRVVFNPICSFVQNGKRTQTPGFQNLVLNLQ